MPGGPGEETGPEFWQEFKKKSPKHSTIEKEDTSLSTVHCFTVTPCGGTRLIVWVCLPHVKAPQEQSNRKMKLLYFYTDIISSLSFLPLKDIKNLQGNGAGYLGKVTKDTHGPTNRRGLSKQECRIAQQVPAESRDRKVPGDTESS